MNNTEIILQNPLRIIEDEDGNMLSANSFGAVLARAGIGKTALLVQLALNTLLRKKNVLHISLNDPVNKVTLWYEEVFTHLVNRLEAKEIAKIWESILPHRFIMTFNVDAFSVPKLEERLNDLVQQNIFFPDMIVLDGLNFDNPAAAILEELKALAVKHTLTAWFSVRVHRHDIPGPSDMPPFFEQIMDLFEVIIRLKPAEKEVYVKILKGKTSGAAQPPLILDPSTMLLIKK
ncbi:MAG: AAA family ATPase [Desulfobacterales bacterium]|nr:AAA family ATPase [Desulfobacterales bacterium]